MRDVLFVAIALAFIGLCYLYVLGCDRIIGRDTTSTGRAGGPDRGATVTDQGEPAVTS